MTTGGGTRQAPATSAPSSANEALLRKGTQAAPARA
jgi:hypothetical protein